MDCVICSQKLEGGYKEDDEEDIERLIEEQLHELDNYFWSRLVNTVI